MIAQRQQIRPAAADNKKQSRMLKASNLASKERSEYINKTLERNNIQNEVAKMQSQQLNAYAKSKGIITGDPQTFNKFDNIKDIESQKTILRKNLYKIFGNHDEDLEAIYSELKDDPNDVIFFNSFFPKILTTLNENVRGGYVTSALFLAFYQRFKQKQQREVLITDPIQDQLEVELWKANAGDHGNEVLEILVFMKNTYDFSKYGYAVIFLLESLAVQKESLEEIMEKMVKAFPEKIFPPQINIIVNHIFRSIIFVLDNEDRENVLEHNRKKLTKYLENKEEDLVDWAKSKINEIIPKLMEGEILGRKIEKIKKPNRRMSRARNERGEEDMEYGQEDEYGNIDYEDGESETGSTTSTASNGNGRVFYPYEILNEHFEMQLQAHFDGLREQKRQNEIFDQNVNNDRVRRQDEEYFDKMDEFEYASRLEAIKLDKSDKYSSLVNYIEELIDYVYEVEDLPMATQYDLEIRISELITELQERINFEGGMLYFSDRVINKILELCDIADVPVIMEQRARLVGQTEYEHMENWMRTVESNAALNEMAETEEGGETYDYGATQQYNDDANETKGEDNAQQEEMLLEQGVSMPEETKQTPMKSNNPSPYKSPQMKMKMPEYIWDINPPLYPVEQSRKTAIGQEFSLNPGGQPPNTYYVTNIEAGILTSVALYIDYKKTNEKPRDSKLRKVYSFATQPIDNKPIMLFWIPDGKRWEVNPNAAIKNKYKERADALDSAIRAYIREKNGEEIAKPSEIPSQPSLFSEVMKEANTKTGEPKKRIPNPVDLEVIDDNAEETQPFVSSVDVTNPNNDDAETQQIGSGLGRIRHSYHKTIKKPASQAHDNRRYLMRGMMR